MHVTHIACHTPNQVLKGYVLSIQIVLFNVQVSNKMPNGEYVFLICQDKRTRRVITIEDNRDRLEAEKLAAGPKSPSMYDQFVKYLGY